MTETERITKEVMSNYGFDANGEYFYPLSDVLGEGPNVSEYAGEGSALEGLRNVLILEVFVGLVIWGLWELHHPIMVMAHWLVSHAR